MEKLENYITVSEAAKLANISHVQAWRLCKSEIWECIQAGRNYLVLKSAAEKYEKRKPGLRKGQKIIIKKL